MADLVITEADVELSSKTSTEIKVQVGEAVKRNQPLYFKSSDSKYWLADNNVDEDTAKATGLSVTSADADGQVLMMQSGPLLAGATLTKAEVYVVSNTAGKIMPIGDLAAGQYLTILGYASSTTTLEVDITATGITK